MLRASNVNLRVDLRFSNLRQLVFPVLLLASTFCSAAISFVQQNSGVPQTSQTSVSATYTAAQAAGDTNVVAIGWADATSSVTSVTDTNGNVYALALAPTRQTGVQSLAIYIASNVVAAAANSNTVTVTFDAAAPYVDVRILEYSGLDTVSPLDGTAGASGTGTTSSAGPITTTNANDLLFAANYVSMLTTGAGAGFTARVITNPDADLAEDQIVTTAGTYTATASIVSGGWVMQLVALKAAGSQPAAATPTFAPVPGTYTSAQSVSLQDTTAGATIFYTLDGSTPTTSSTVYTTPIQVSATTTIKAMAVASGLANSAVATGAYTIGTPAAIAFVQANSATPQTPQTSVSVTYTSAQAAGDTNVVAIGWADATSSVTSVTDTNGNLYALALAPTQQTGVQSLAIYFASNVVAAAANSNTVTVTFNAAAPYPDVRILEYSGLDTVSPLDGTAGASGTGTTSSAGPVTTTNANDLLFAANYVSMLTNGAGAGFTARVITNPDADIAEDQVVSAAGTHTATASVASGGWVMQLVALKAAGSQPAAATPTFSPVPGTYTSAQSASLQDTTAGTTIFYTLDGSTPTTSSTVYTAPIPVSTAATIKAMAAAGGFSNSAIATGAYTIQVAAAATPTFSPVPGTYTSAQSASLQDTTAGATIFYTLDGSTPTTASTVYTTPIQVSANTTIQAIAVASGLSNSAVAAGAYTIGAPAAIAFVQQNSAEPQTPQTSVSATYAAAQAAGDTNVVAIGWADDTSSVTSVTDTNGNVYALALSPTRRTGVQSLAIYVASNLVAAAANSNTVTVAFDAAAPYPDVRVLEYSGLDTVSPLDGTAGASGTGTTSSAGPVTTTNANDLLFAANYVSMLTNGAGAGFTARVITNPDADIAEDQVVSAAGTHTATASVASGGWVMQLVALKAAGSQPAAATPTFSPVPGTYTSAQSASLQDTTAGTTIFYTLDGSTPTTSSTVYTAPIPVSTAATIKAMAAAGGFSNSAIATGAYTIQVAAAATPTFSPVPGTYTSAQSASLQDTTAGATIFYTLDGSTPTTASTVYTTPIQVSANTTIQAIAVASGLSNSAVATGAYTIGAPAAIAFVQVNSATPQTPQASVSVTYTAAQTAGDTNIVVIGWSDATSTIASVTDTNGNTYSPAIGPTQQAGIQSQAIYVAPNIVAAGAGANSVTVTFSGSVPFPDMRILEYSGLAAVSPLDAAVGGTGNGTTSNSGSLTTTSPNELLFAASTVDSITTGAGTGYTSRVITSTDSNIAEDQGAAAVGTYSATASMSSGNWVMQLIALRAASQTAGTQPTAPGNLAALAAGTNQINLSWTASTDSLGVTGYLVERCQGSGCTNFAQINTSSTTAYSDLGLSSGTTYVYRVRATDAAGNLSGYSNTATASVGGATLSLSPQAVTLTFTQTQQFTGASGSATWMVDGIAGGSASSGTITNTGLYSPPSHAGVHSVAATASGQTASATVYVTNYPGTFMRDVDKLRTGLNPNETVLTPANVNSTQFGKLFSYSIDGTADASPLYVPNLNIPGQGFHNVVFVATEHDSVYAFDADGLQTTPLWQDSFIDPANGITVVPPNDTGECCDISPEIGITGTPVIDPNTNTLYVVVKTKEVSGGNTNYFHRLHALDLTTGAEKFGGPVNITATAPGNGAGSSGGQIPFYSLHQNQRAALLLDNGVVYIAFGAHGDNSPYHGWIFGYDAGTLQQTMFFNTSPNDNGIRSTGGGQGSGVWQSGDGIATDATGNLYFVTGNGVFDVNNGGPDYGDSFMRLSTSGTVVDYFTPHDQQYMNDQDIDLGSGGVLLLPDQPGPHPHLAITAGKNGTIYVIDRDNMGQYNPNNDNQIVQSVTNIFPNGNKNTGNFKAAVYWNGHLFFSPDADFIKSFAISNGQIMGSPTSQSSFIANYPGATLQLSANGNTNGILWAIQRVDLTPSGSGVRGPGVLHAFDATDLFTELYNSSQASGGRDVLDMVAKWSAPLIANGKVYVASESRLTAFGLLP